MLHTELVHFYTDKLKDKVKKVTVRMIYDTSGFREVHNTDNIPLLLMNLFLYFMINKVNSMKRSTRFLVVTRRISTLHFHQVLIFLQTI